MPTQTEAIIEAFQSLQGVRSISEISNWVCTKYGEVWRDFATVMSDMVPKNHGGNNSSNVPEQFRVLVRVSRGHYCLLPSIESGSQSRTNFS